MNHKIWLAVVCAALAVATIGAGCSTDNTTETTTTTTTPAATATPAEAMDTYQDVTPADAKEMIETTPDLVILDVSNAYAQGHIPGAINYYVGDGSLDDAIPTLEKDVPYLVYCHVDSASISGAEKLIEAGFPEVYRLEGNYSAWVDAGYDIEK